MEEMSVGPRPQLRLITEPVSLKDQEETAIRSTMRPAEGRVREEGGMFKINAMDHIVLNVPDINRSPFTWTSWAWSRSGSTSSAGERSHFPPCVSAQTS